jgi:hypothetical protein
MTPATYYSFNIGLLVENRRRVPNLANIEYIIMYVADFGDALFHKATSYYGMDFRDPNFDR